MISKYIKFTAIVFFLNVNCLLAQSTITSTRSAQAALRQSMINESVLKSLPIRNIGPSAMGGRVTDVDVNPANPAEFYVAYATGGLWYSKNNGQSLVPVFEKENTIGIGDIAVNWQKNIIWVGTGESNSSRSSYAGDGIYKSTDSGKTWQYKGLEKSGHIAKVILNPSNDNEVWVGVIGNLYSANAERGVYKTIDGGNSWRKTLFVNDNTGVIDLVADPKNINTLYAAAWYRTRRAWNFEEGGATSGIYKSTDGGENWKLISTKSSGFPSNAGVGRIGLAAAASQPGTLYAVVDNQNHRPDTAQKKESKNYSINDFKNIDKQKLLGLDTNKLDSFFRDNYFDKKYTAKSVMKMVKDDSLKSTAIFDYLFDANTALFETPVIGAEVYKSTNDGASWTKVNTAPLELYNTYGYYFGNIFVAPSDADKVVIGGYDLQLSTDGGASFKRVDKPATHADWHSAWIDPTDSKRWIAGNDGGLNITYDDGQHWFKINTPSVGQFYKITVDDAKPYNVYGGLQDNGTWYGPSTTKDSDQWDYEDGYAWKRIGGGDGMQVQVDTRDNSTVYYGSQFGYYNRRNLKGGRGTSIYPRADLGQPLYRFNWQTPILLSKHNPDILYYATNKLLRSWDKGDNFEVLSADLTNGKRDGDVPFGTITAIAESPLQFNILYVGTDDGNVWVSKNAGYDWSKITTGLPTGLYISRITASKYKAGKAYLSLSAYRDDKETPFVFVTENFGTTWKPIMTNLGAATVNVVIEDEQKENFVYVGTDKGLFMSKDGGQAAIAMSSDLPTVPVHDLVIQARENELVIGTHGRGVYIIVLQDVYDLLDGKPLKKKKETRDRRQ